MLYALIFRLICETEIFSKRDDFSRFQCVFTSTSSRSSFSLLFRDLISIMAILSCLWSNRLTSFFRNQIEQLPCHLMMRRNYIWQLAGNRKLILFNIMKPIQSEAGKTERFFHSMERFFHLKKILILRCPGGILVL